MCPKFLCFQEFFWTFYSIEVGITYAHFTDREVNNSGKLMQTTNWWPHLCTQAVVTAGVRASPEPAHGDKNFAL